MDEVVEVVQNEQNQLNLIAWHGRACIDARFKIRRSQIMRILELLPIQWLNAMHYTIICK